MTDTSPGTSPATGAAGQPPLKDHGRAGRDLPAAVLSAVVLLWITGLTINIMTLGGMAAAVGLIIDDAIVMIEHIVRRLRGAGSEHHGRVMAATAASKSGCTPLPTAAQIVAPTATAAASAAASANRPARPGPAPAR